jgi:hypothetical protein
MKRPGQSNAAFIDWPWRSFVLHAIALACLGIALGAGINAWMARSGRTVETAITVRVDAILGLGLAVILLSVAVAVRYWKRAPFLWAILATGAIILGNPGFALVYVLFAVATILISSKLRDLVVFWFKA